ncbi:FAD/NAD(P)-binding protein [Streptomyces inhibens]|uniref:FAD/NAD(P)-binding protein n=1 Tax=Streptomyces inhibens TaxID=2293571 RepID=UPI00402AB27D
MGAGAAGTLTAARLLDAADTARLPVEVQLIDPAAATGQGAAYSTTDPRHLLNVPAGKLSARPDRPDDFTAWLTGKLSRRVGSGEYVSRLHYGHYLSDHLARAIDGTAHGRFRRRHERVVDLVDDDGPRPVFSSGAQLRADSVVLALGQLPADSDWLPGPVTAAGIISDPWAPGALDRVPPHSDVLLVGTGLTMSDLALTLARPGRVVHAVSRHGLVPQRHTPRPLPAVTPPPYRECGDLPSLRRMVLHQAAVCRRLYGDWRPAIDGLRPWTAALWQRMTPEDRRRFLAEDHRHWEVHRHRMPPQTADALSAARADGRVSITAGHIVRATPTGSGVHLRLSDGRPLHVGAVVNCTGAQRALHESTDPLISSLLSTGLGRAGPLGLGLDTADDGRLLPSAGHRPAPVWTLGSLRLGNLWETTAIPEIRVQAAEVAAGVVAHALRPARASVTAAGRGAPGR